MKERMYRTFGILFFPPSEGKEKKYVLLRDAAPPSLPCLDHMYGGYEKRTTGKP